MTRHARGKILYDGCYAHIFSRSLETRWIFQKAEDFAYFQKLLIDHKDRYGFKIHHYCLMNTHFHLAVSLSDWQLFSQGLKSIKWKYTTVYNKKHKRRGPLWQERFKSLLIEDERYLNACGLYIENNPVKAGMVKKAVDWPYSSARYFEQRKKDPVVDGYGRERGKEIVGVFTDEFFTKGPGIGSELFRLQLRDEVTMGVPVP
jgi:putative transposase